MKRENDTVPYRRWMDLVCDIKHLKFDRDAKKMTNNWTDWTETGWTN